MGRPINKRHFGALSQGGSQIRVIAYHEDTAAVRTDGYIVKQKNSTTFIIAYDGIAYDKADPTTYDVCKLADDVTPPLGYCAIAATPYGGAAEYVSKISGRRLTTFAAGISYTYSTKAATVAGQADLYVVGERVATATGTAVITNGIVATGSVTVVGATYTGGLKTTTGGTGTGATLTITVDGGGLITGATVTAGGSGYTAADILTVVGGDGAGRYTVATVTNGAITSITLGTGGATYASAPAVTITGDGAGAAYTAVIALGVVTSYTKVTAGSGYTAATVTVAAP